MALSWAHSKVDRFEEKVTGSSLGPGDYNPCLPKSQGMAGAVSLGFTSTKGPRAKDREEPIPEETEAILNAARDRTSVSAVSNKRSTFGCSSRPALVIGTSRLEKVKADQQAKQLAWTESERAKLQAEVKTLRSLQVRQKRRGEMICFFMYLYTRGHGREGCGSQTAVWGYQKHFTTVSDKSWRELGRFVFEFARLRYVLLHLLASKQTGRIPLRSQMGEATIVYHSTHEHGG